MAALGWLINLDFAASGTGAPGPQTRSRLMYVGTTARGMLWTLCSSWPLV